ncbi:MAG: alpha-amylase [Myxococcales bacterium]|nr:alpha-amylase [Myxococcales bacterium]
MRRTLPLLSLLAAGCMSFDGLEEPVELSTHVEDWRDQIIYQVMIDRFEDGDYGLNFRVDTTAQARWHGGDWAGLESRLDYLAELGVTALWISPVYKNVDTDAGVDGYHGYWPQDFTQPNPHFGDIKALRSLVSAAHERDIYIIVDVVTNHVGQLFYYDINLNGQADEQVRGGGEQSPVIHINEYDPDFDPRGIQAETSLGEAGLAPVIFSNDPASNHLPPQPEVLQNPNAYNRKGRTLDFDDPAQLLRGDFPGGLKDLNTTRCDVKEAMVDVYARWVELTDVDGFRIDTIKHVEREFWRYFTQKVRQRLAEQGKTNFYMFGESFDGRVDMVAQFTQHDLPDAETLARENECVSDGRAITGDQLDGMFDFPQYYQVMRDVFQNGAATAQIQSLWEQRPMVYGLEANELGTGRPPIETLVNFIDNHDVPRFLFEGSVEGLHLAMTYALTEQGIPCIYYGTEQRFDGGNDPANREDMWLSGFDTSAPTFSFLSRLTALRKAYPALRRGAQTVVWASDHVADESDAGIFAFERAGGDAGASYALVILNNHRQKASAPRFETAAMTVTAAPGTVLVDVLGGGGQVTVAGDGTLAPDVPAASAMILVPQAQVVSGI